MLVAELIEKLKKFDPEQQVRAFDITEEIDHGAILGLSVEDNIVWLEMDSQ